MTPFGLTLAHALEPLCAWGERNQALVEDIMLTRPKQAAPATAPEPVSG
jgi:DNA-binding HxlR family transcriptional regulator